MIELPAGIVGDKYSGETFIEAARRELLEETGYLAAPRSFIYIGAVANSAGITDEITTFFCTTNIEKVAEGGGADDDEDIDVLHVPLDSITMPEVIRSAAMSGSRLLDAKILTGLWLALAGEYIR